MKINKLFCKKFIGLKSELYHVRANVHQRKVSIGFWFFEIVLYDKYFG
jgi:hypothetical protein